MDEHVRLGDYATLRAGMQHLPELESDAPGLWPAQAEAIRNLEQSLRENRPRALIQMATGAGKTFTAANVCYRLLRHAGARRILFLVDRANLGRQAVREFEGFTVPDDPRKFTELYNVRRLASSQLDMADEAATKVHVSTIQRLYSILRGDDDYDESLDEQTGFDTAPTQPVEVSYNPRVPIESYDLIIIDECHRSIYGVWRQVLEYFDAFLVGLTATPGTQTFAFFEQNMVMEYGHEQAVADRVNVDFDVFRIRTEITESGGTVPADFVTEFRDRETRQLRFEKVDEDIDYNAAELDRKVVAPDQIRTVAKTLRASLPKIFKDRERDADGLLKHIPKTLIFAKDDSHADDIVQVVRQEFVLGNDGAVKITYKSGDSGNKPEQLLQQFRTNYPTRIAVTVDMIATGTDVKPIECVVFMRMVRSRNFFEQMKGRGVRVIDENDLRAVTPDAKVKDRFVIVDAVGVTDVGLHDTVPLERNPSVGFDQLMNQVGLGSTDAEVVSSVASRLARLNRRITAEDRAEVEDVAGIGLGDLVRQITDALNPDYQHAAAAAEAGTEDPTPEQVAATAKRLIEEAVQPIAGNAALRQKLIDVRRSYEQVMDTATKDKVISGEFSREAADRAREQTQSFRQFIEDHKDEITALQVLYSQPYGGGLTYADIKELAEAIKRPPHRWTPEALWRAYETLDASRVRGSGHRVSTDLVSLVRHALGQTDELIAYPDLVDERFEGLAGSAADPRPQLHRGTDRLPPPNQGTHRRQPRSSPSRPSEPTLQHPRRPRQSPPTLRQRPQPPARRTNPGPSRMNGDLPRGWAWASLQNLCEVTLGQSPPSSSYNNHGSGEPFFQGKAEFGDRFPAVKKWTTEPKKRATAGSVLISVRAPVGPTNIASMDCDDWPWPCFVTTAGWNLHRFLLLWAMRNSARELARNAAGQHVRRHYRTTVEISSHSLWRHLRSRSGSSPSSKNTSPVSTRWIPR